MAGPDSEPLMRVLLLCDRIPYPLQNGQNLRIFHYVRLLKNRHSFDLLCYGDGAIPAEVQPLFRSIEVFPRPSVPQRRGLARLKAAFDVSELMPSSPAVRRHLAKILPVRGYDLVWVSGWDMILNLPQPAGVPVVADMVDDGVLEYRRELAAATTLKARLRQLKWLAMNWLFERRYFGPADEVVLVAEEDARVFGKVCPRTSVNAINNGVDAQYFAPLPAAPEPQRIVFEGNVSFGPNVDAVQYFARDVLPLIREQVPQVQFQIVGKDPSPEVQALQSGHIEVTGFVDDIRPYLGAANVFVCPLRKGAGIKNKILQAWAMGKAVVASSVAVGGLRYRDGENIVIADGPADFAAAVVDLIRNPDKAARIGAAARATIEQHYTWEAKADELESVLARAAGKALPDHKALTASHA